MEMKRKAIELIKRFGAPVRFAVGLILKATLPSGSAFAALIEKVFECVHETAKDEYDFDESKLPSVSECDFLRIEQILDILGSDLRELLEKVCLLEQVPERAAQILEVALQTDQSCMVAVSKIDALALRFDRLEDQNGLLLAGQQHAAGMLGEMLPLVRKIANVPPEEHLLAEQTTELLEKDDGGVRDNNEPESLEEDLQQITPLCFKSGVLTPFVFHCVQKAYVGEFQPKVFRIIVGSKFFQPVIRPLDTILGTPCGENNAVRSSST